LIGTWQAAVGWLALVAVGIYLRLRHLMDVPEFTDEIVEVQRAVPIARGEDFPLVNVSAYIGAWHNYLTAGALVLSGFDLTAARLLSLVFGMLTVLLTYALARELGCSRPVAFFAAVLLCVSGAHVVVGSRLAISNATTPFYTTLASILILRSLNRGDPRLLVIGAFVAGLALQTHPMAIVLVATLAGYYLWHERTRLRSIARWIALALVVFLLAYSPVLIYNLQRGPRTVSVTFERSQSYLKDESLTPKLYAQNLSQLVLGLSGALASRFELEEQRARLKVPTDLGIWLTAALALAALAWSARRGMAVVPLLTLTTALSLPLLNGKYELIGSSRYLFPLLPFIYAAEAHLLVAALVWAKRRLQVSSSAPNGRMYLKAAGVGLGAAALAAWSVLAQLVRTDAYEREVSDVSPNRARVALVAQIDEVRRPGELVLLDRSFEDHQGYARIMTLLFDLRGAEPRVMQSGSQPELGRVLRKAPGGSVLLIAPEGPAAIAGDAELLGGAGDSLIRPEESVLVYRLSALEANPGRPPGPVTR